MSWQISKNEEIQISPEKSKIARGISNSFLKKIRELQSKPLHMAFISELQKKALATQKLGQTETRNQIEKQIENKNSFETKKINEEKFQKQGLKITKGQFFLDDNNNKILDTNGKPITFDFSILFDEQGHAIAIDEHLGSGQFGQGRVAADLNELSKEIFVKVFRTFKKTDIPSEKQIIKRGGPYERARVTDVVREIKKHKMNNTYLGFVVTNNKAFLIQERAFGIDLFDFIVNLDNEMIKNKTNHHYDMIKHKICLRYLAACISICQEVQRLHSKDIIHRDIKLENIIYNEENQTAKLIDIATFVHLTQAKSFDRTPKKFGKEDEYSGIKKIKERNELVFFTPYSKRIGTAKYIAPEIVQTYNKNNQTFANFSTWKGEFSKASDRYAVGKCIATIFTRFLGIYQQNPELLDEPTLILIKEIKDIVNELTSPIISKRPELNLVINDIKKLEAQFYETTKEQNEITNVDKVSENKPKDINCSFSRNQTL